MKLISKYDIYIVALLGIMASGIFVTFFGYPISGFDAVQYDRLGHNLATKHLFSLSPEAPFRPTMFREPGYPFFLAIIYTIFGHNITMVLFFQVLIHAATAILTYCIAKEIFSRGAALFSGISVALFPTLANMAGYALSETFFTFILCLGLYAYLISVKKENTFLFIISGTIFGIAALTKSAAVLLPPALVMITALISAVKMRNLKRVILGLLSFLVIFVLTVTGWSVRNKILFNTYSLALRGGEALWSRAEKLDDSNTEVLASAAYGFSEFLGNRLFPAMAGRPERYLFKDFEKAEKLRAGYAASGLTDAQIEEIFRKEAVDKISKRPFRYLGYTPIEAIKMASFTYLPLLNESSVRGYFSTVKDGGLILSGIRGTVRLAAYPLLLLSFIGLIKHRKKWDKWLLLVAAVFYFNLVYSLLDAIGRYAVPLIPLYCIMAVAAFFPSLNLEGR